MRKLLIAAAMLLPGMTGCSDDELQSGFSGYPTSHFQLNGPLDEGSSAGVAKPDFTDIGDDH